MRPHARPVAAAPILVWVLVWALACTLSSVPPASAAPLPIRAWLEAQAEHRGLDLPEATLDGLADSWRRATAAGAQRPDREAAFRELLMGLIESFGLEGAYPQGPPASWIARVDELEGAASPPDLLPGAAPQSALGSVAETGEGPLPVVLLAGEIPAEVLFPEFLALHRERFHAVTVDLPGVGGTPSPPMPARLDYAARPWLARAQGEIVAEIGRRDLDRPLLVGHGLGAWVALSIARERPGAFRGVVLVDPVFGTVVTGIPSGWFGLLLRDRQGRLDRLEDALPPLLPPLPKADPRQPLGMPWIVPALARDSGAARRVADGLTRTLPAVLARLGGEAHALDRRQALDGLETPILTVLALHDETSPLWTASFAGATSWAQAHLDASGSLEAVVPFDDVRNPFLDEPRALGQALVDFAAGHSVEAPRAEPQSASNPASKPRRVNAGVGTTEVAIEYWAPRGRGREVWGGVVPWDTLWRAGANEATRLSVSRPVELGGAKLAAGEYALFVLPRENGPWSLVVHRVPWSWGTAGHDPRYDLATVDLEPEPTSEWVEAVTFDVVEATAGQGELSLAWGERRLAVPLVASDGLSAAMPVGAERLGALHGWRELAEDPPGDAANGAVHDGVGLAAAYECASDTVWFRFTLASPVHEEMLGLNVAVDTDRDLSTGVPWWATNRGATFDRLVTMWVEGSDASGYLGTIGVAEGSAAAAGDFEASLQGGLELGFDRPRREIYLGVPARALDDDGDLALIATVGTNSVWTDDLIDDGQAVLSLDALRRAGCGGP